MRDTALLIIDVQNDFCHGGALAVPRGDEVVPVLNRYIRQAEAASQPVFASRDWHPAESQHFLAGGGPWPPHCIQGTTGAAFHPALDLPADVTVITKGDNPRDDGYSAFDGHDAQGSALLETLQAREVNRLLVGGLATDYCVRASVLDARRHGFNVVLLLDAMRGIDRNSGNEARALDAMVRAGATTATLNTIAMPHMRR